MDFELAGEITNIEPIAVNLSIRDRRRLWRWYGKGRWRKLKGEAMVRLPSGNLRYAEIHWYEAHGIGKRELKVTKFLD
ncbi:MAG: hypothetical protein ABI977_09525 [Acidobacteriota bacterium]